MDSMSRYGSVDATNIEPNLARYGWTSSSTRGLFHRTSGSLFGAPHLHTTSWPTESNGVLQRSWSGMATLGISAKVSPVALTADGTWEEWLTVCHLGLSSSNNVSVQLLITASGATTSAGLRNTSVRGYRLTNPGGSQTNETTFASELLTAYTPISGNEFDAWRATYGTLNWIHLDVLYNVSTRNTSVRLVMPSGIVYTFNNTHGVNSLTPTVFWMGSSSMRSTIKLSDFVMWTADSVGLSAFPANPRQLRVQRLAPTANGSLNNWVPNTGTNHGAVSEVPPSDAQWSAGIGIGTKQTFVMGTGGLGTGANSVKSGILGVQLNPRILDAGGNVSAARPIQIIGGQETNMTTAITPSRVTHTPAPTIVTVNPVTSLPYTAAQINAAEIGFTVQ